MPIAGPLGDVRSMSGPAVDPVVGRDALPERGQRCLSSAFRSVPTRRRDDHRLASGPQGHKLPAGAASRAAVAAASLLRRRGHAGLSSQQASSLMPCSALCQIEPFGECCEMLSHSGTSGASADLIVSLLDIVDGSVHFWGSRWETWMVPLFGILGVANQDMHEDIELHWLSSIEWSEGEGMVLRRNSGRTVRIEYDRCSDAQAEELWRLWQVLVAATAGKETETRFTPWFAALDTEAEQPAELGESTFRPFAQYERYSMSWVVEHSSCADSIVLEMNVPPHVPRVPRLLSIPRNSCRYFHVEEMPGRPARLRVGTAESVLEFVYDLTNGSEASLAAWLEHEVLHPDQ